MWLLKYAIFGADFESVEMKCPCIRRIMLSVRGTFLLTPTVFFPYKIGRNPFVRRDGRFSFI
jgi:hypothetical protein